MKLTHTIIVCLVIGLMIGCKSKHKTVHKPYKKTNTSQKRTAVKVKQPVAVPEVKNRTILYIEKFRDAAMEEMRKYKIPASITLAQGILESGSGQSELTLNSNNHFGIKCHKGWTGKRYLHDDDEKDECFRVYKDPAKSYRDHSLFLVGRSRYDGLFKLDEGDYVAWAKGLSRAGYATDRRYPAKLIGIIEKYQLFTYDTQVLGKRFKKKEVHISQIESHVVVKGDTLYAISRKYDISVADLKKLNALNSNSISIGQVLLVKK